MYCVNPRQLVSASNDQVWLSTAVSQDIVSYLEDHQFAHAVTHKSYPAGRRWHAVPGTFRS